MRRPLVIVEIIIAPGKAAQLPIYEGDDPSTLCQNFSMTYNLGRVARQSLLGILESHLSKPVDPLSEEEEAETDLKIQTSAQKRRPLLEVFKDYMDYSEIVEVSEKEDSDYLLRQRSKGKENVK